LFVFFSQYSNYNTAINYLVTVPKYRIQAQEIARQEGLLSDPTKKNRGKKMNKQEEEAILKQIVEQKLDIKGGYKKPSKFDNDKGKSAGTQHQGTSTPVQHLVIKLKAQNLGIIFCHKVLGKPLKIAQNWLRVL
jgi:hypothetical protein